jgi:hypothetical protein
MNKIVLFDFMSLQSGPNLAAFSQQVLTRMSENQAYADIQTVANNELKTAVEEFSRALNEAADRSLVTVARKRSAMTRLKEVLQRTALELELKARGDAAYVLDAGFRARNPAQRSQAPIEPVNGLTLESPANGLITLQFKPSPGARMYVAEWRTDDETTWHNGAYPSATRVTLDGFPSRKEVWVRVSAIGSQMRKSPPCDPVKVFVL